MTRSASETARADGAAVARERHDAALVDLVDEPQAVQVLVEEGDLGLHALRDPGRVPSHVPRAQDDDVCGAHAGDAAEQDAAPSVLPLEEVRADLRGHPAGHLAHRCEQRERSRLELHGLVGDAGHLLLEQRVGDRRVRGEVQIGEEDEPGAEPSELLGLGLLDLHHDVGACPHVVGRCRRSRRRQTRSRRRGSTSRRRRRPRRARRHRAPEARDTPSGVIATRCSPSLTSRGTPTVHRVVIRRVSRSRAEALPRLAEHGAQRRFDLVELRVARDQRRRQLHDRSRRGRRDDRSGRRRRAAARGSRGAGPRTPRR